MKQESDTAINENDSQRDNKNQSEYMLRDHLAIERTILANARTLLAYTRTFLAFLLTGASMIHFLQNIYLKSLGVGFIIISLFIMVIGIMSYFKFKKKINSIDIDNI